MSTSETGQLVERSGTSLPGFGDDLNVFHGDFQELPGDERSNVNLAEGDSLCYRYCA